MAILSVGCRNPPQASTRAFLEPSLTTPRASPRTRTGWTLGRERGQQGPVGTGATCRKGQVFQAGSVQGPQGLPGPSRHLAPAPAGLRVRWKLCAPARFPLTPRWEPPGPSGNCRQALAVQVLRAPRAHSPQAACLRPSGCPGPTGCADVARSFLPVWPGFWAGCVCGDSSGSALDIQEGALQAQVTLGLAEPSTGCGADAGPLGWEAGEARGSEPGWLGPLSTQGWMAWGWAENSHMTGPVPRSVKQGSPSAWGCCQEGCTFYRGAVSGEGLSLLPD